MLDFSSYYTPTTKWGGGAILDSLCRVGRSVTRSVGRSVCLQFFRVRTGDEKSLNLGPSPWKVLNSDSEKKSLKSPWIFSIWVLLYEILSKCLVNPWKMTEISKIISFKTRKKYILGSLVCLSVEQTSRQSLSYGTVPVRNSTGNSSVCNFHDQLFFAPNNNGFFF